MSNPDNIDKIFNELMSNSSIEDTSVRDKFNLTKELIHMQESLLESLLNVNSLIYYTHTEPDYEIPENVSELLGPLFKISEDFISTMIELNVSFEVEEHLEDEEEDE